MKSKKTVIDLIFWFCFILYTNPGGIQEALQIKEIGSGYNLNDVIFLILTLLYVLTGKKWEYLSRNLNKLFFFLILFLAYYIIGFGLLVPNYYQTNTSILNVLIKLRYGIYSYIFVFYIYHFFKRSHLLFIRTLLISSLLVVVFFLITIITDIQILPLIVLPRGFINLDRNIMVSYGLMQIFIPLGIVQILIKNKTNYTIIIYTTFILVTLTIILSLTRRHILGLIINFIIGYFLITYIRNLSIIKRIKIVFRIVIIGILILLIIDLFFPAYIKSIGNIINETFYVIEHGETTTGQEDERLSLSKPFILEVFKENPYFGMGFDNRWRTSTGDEEGYEASDYPFISALAMTGIFGILLFLPIYLTIIRIIIKDIKFIRKNILPRNSILFSLHLSFIIFFIYDLIKYMDWFLPISNPSQFTWFCMLGLYLATREMLYKDHYNNVNINELQSLYYNS